MNLRDYLRVLQRRWVTILVVLVAALAGAAIVTVLQPPTYRSSTDVLVALPAGGGDPTTAGANLTYTTSLPSIAAAYARIATTPPAVQAAVDAAALSSTPAVGVLATVAPGTSTITVAVTATSPDVAQAVANAYPETLPDTLVRLNQLSSRDALSFTVLRPAVVPSSPSSPDPVVNTAIGLGVGLVLGLLLAVAREALDRRIRDSRGIEERLGVTVLGVVPNELQGTALPALSHPDSPRTEAYRKVRTGLLFSGADGLPASLAVTSALAGEGKTSLATNLAVVCAQAGQQVALVDADLRQPTLHERFDLDNAAGLSNVLAGELSLGEVARTHSSGVTVVTSGPSPRDPSALLEGHKLRAVLDELASAHDVVIIDTTPTLAVSDAAQVCAASEGAVVVSRLRRTTFDSLRKTLTTLERVKASPLGVVAVGHDEDPDAGYRYYYTSHTSPSPASTPSAGSHRRSVDDATPASNPSAWRRQGSR